MAESRQIPNESDLDGKRLNRGNFLRRTELLRRIHWKTWMLLVSFAAYGVLPFAAVQFGEIGKEFFPLLLFVPMIFFLENRLNGKDFRCPVCHKKMELVGRGDGQRFVCSCGHKEKLSAFQDRRNKEGKGANKRDVANYMKKQAKETEAPINNAFAEALAKLNTKD